MTLTYDELCIDAADPFALGSWWAEALGWPPVAVDEDGDVVLTPPPGSGPKWLFLAVPESKTIKNRLHLDFRPDDQTTEVERLVAMGARHVDIGQTDADDWVVLADPEGNEFCVLAANP